MSLRLYMDVNVRQAIASGLRQRGIDVLTAHEDLDRAGNLGRVLFSNDADFLSEAAARQQAGQTFAGLIYAHQYRSNRQCIDDLELLAKLQEPDDFVNRVEYLPL